MENSDSDVSDIEYYFFPNEIKLYRFEPRCSTSQISDSDSDNEQHESDGSLDLV